MYPWCRAAQGPVPLLLALLGLPGLRVLLRPPRLRDPGSVDFAVQVLPVFGIWHRDTSSVLK